MSFAQAGSQIDDVCKVNDVYGILSTLLKLASARSRTVKLVKTAVAFHRNRMTIQPGADGYTICSSVVPCKIGMLSVVRQQGHYS